MKTCTVCKQELPFSNFHKLKKSKDGHGYRCRTCDYECRKKYRCNADPEYRRILERRQNLKQKYGITIAEYDSMLDSQNGVCAICGGVQTVPDTFKSRDLSVDHDHHTGKVRGLLCNNCNRGLGFLGDTVESLSKALGYLKGTECH